MSLSNRACSCGSIPSVRSYNRIPAHPAVSFPHLTATLINWALRIAPVPAGPQGDTAADYAPSVEFVPPRSDFWRRGDLPPTHNQIGYVRALARAQGVSLLTMPTSKRAADRLIKRLRVRGGGE